MKNIYIIEDDEVVRNLLVRYLDEIIPEYELVGTSVDGETAREDCVKLNPDLVILDLYLPGINGLEILHFIKSNLPKTKVIIFSGIAEKKIYDIAVQGKADGYVIKSSGFEEFYHAVNTYMRGGHILQSGVSQNTALYSHINFIHCPHCVTLG